MGFFSCGKKIGNTDLTQSHTYFKIFKFSLEIILNDFHAETKTAGYEAVRDIRRYIEHSAWVPKS